MMVLSQMMCHTHGAQFAAIEGHCPRCIVARAVINLNKGVVAISDPSAEEPLKILVRDRSMDRVVMMHELWEAFCKAHDGMTIREFREQYAASWDYLQQDE